MRQDVEQAGARGLRELLEVRAPDPVGIADLLPDVVPSSSTAPCGEEVDRADDVVEVVGVEDVPDPILGPGTKSISIPSRMPIERTNSQYAVRSSRAFSRQNG